MSSTRKWQFRPGNCTFGQNAMAESKQLGRPAARVRAHRACFFDEFLLLNQPPEILFVHEPTGKRLDATLELQQREDRLHQFEDDGAVFDLGAQPGDAGCKNATVISLHGPAEDRLRNVWTVSAVCLLDKRRLVKQFVALQDQFLVPGIAI